MKRAMLSTVAGAFAAASFACSPVPSEEPRNGDQATAGWTRPPAVTSVERAGAGLVVSGTAEPEGRVVLRSDEGEAYAASADARGRFEVRLPAPARHLLLRPETQVGQDAAPSPDQLLILAGGEGPIAVLRTGAPTRRLDAAPALGAIDSDGGMRLASGRAPSGVPRVEVRSGAQIVEVVPDRSGQWSVMLPPRERPDEIEVAGRAFTWPGAVAPSTGLSVARAGAGWRIGWSGPGGARQSTWLPLTPP